MMRPISLALCCALLGVLAGCDEADTSSLRLRLHADGGGTVVLSSLQTDATVTAPDSEGVNWSAGARVVAVSGTFPSLCEKNLRIHDIEVLATWHGGRDRLWLELRLPLGPAARWPRALAPTNPEDRAKVRALLDPEADASKLGLSARLAVEWPDGFKPLSSQLSVERVAKSKSDEDARRTDVTVTLDRALDAEQAGKTLSWHLLLERATAR